MRHYWQAGGLASSRAVDDEGPTAFTQVEFTLLFIEFRGAAEFLLSARTGGRKIQALGKENPSRGKENPSLGEGKSKPGEGKSKLCPSAHRAFSKGCAGPPGHLQLPSRARSDASEDEGRSVIASREAAWRSRRT